MVRRTNNRGKRRGAYLVETALVLIPLMMLILAIVEYGWLWMNWNVLNNAAREGCRYAIVNNTAPTINTDVTNFVTTRMMGRTASYNNFTVTVSGTHNGAPTPVTTLAPGDFVTVTISGKYLPLKVMPFIPLPSFTVTSAVTMICEGGT